jgi:hypothetical protein
MKKNTFINIFLSTITLILFTLPSNGQSNTQKKLIGLWRQIGTTTVDGKTYPVATGNYRITNPDNTFLMFTNTINPSPNAAFWQSGTYQILSDSSSVEQILVHITGWNNRTLPVRFYFIDENTYISKWSMNGVDWISERWERIYPAQTATVRKLSAKDFEGAGIKPINEISGKIR